MFERFALYRGELGVIEDGLDPLVVQMQVGHRHASTTAIYTAVNAVTFPHERLAGSGFGRRPVVRR
jgi:hypothetical protein